MPYPAMAGHVQVWVDETAPRPEAMVSYVVGFPPVEMQSAASQEWNNVAWKDVEIDLSALSGTIHLRLGLEVGEYGAATGWVIDDLLVRSGSSVTEFELFLPILLEEE